MKKSLIIIICLICTMQIIWFSPNNIAYSDGEYLRVITDDTPFYKNSNDTFPLFYLPYTYYVKVLGENGGFIHVECYGDGNTPAMDGYVPKDYLFSDNLSVSSPFVVLDVTTAKTAVLYSDFTLSTPVQYIFSDRTLHYYGKYFCGEEIIYFVDYNGKLGYVKESEIFPFSIPNHPNELTFLAPEPTPEQPPPQTQNSENSLKIIIIASLIFAGIIALIFAFGKTKAKGVAVAYYDDNDYE